jgi:hypothetical protein
MSSLSNTFGYNSNWNGPDSFKDNNKQIVQWLEKLQNDLDQFTNSAGTSLTTGTMNAVTGNITTGNITNVISDSINTRNIAATEVAFSQVDASLFLALPIAKENIVPGQIYSLFEPISTGLSSKTDVTLDKIEGETTSAGGEIPVGSRFEGTGTGTIETTFSGSLDEFNSGIGFIGVYTAVNERIATAIVNFTDYARTATTGVYSVLMHQAEAADSKPFARFGYVNLNPTEDNPKYAFCVQLSSALQTGCNIRIGGYNTFSQIQDWPNKLIVRETVVTTDGFYVSYMNSPAAYINALTGYTATLTTATVNDNLTTPKITPVAERIVVGNTGDTFAYMSDVAAISGGLKIEQGYYLGVTLLADDQLDTSALPPANEVAVERDPNARCIVNLKEADAGDTLYIAQWNKDWPGTGWKWVTTSEDPADFYQGNAVQIGKTPKTITRTTNNVTPTYPLNWYYNKAEDPASNFENAHAALAMWVKNDDATLSWTMWTIPLTHYVEHMELSDLTNAFNQPRNSAVNSSPNAQDFVFTENDTEDPAKPNTNNQYGYTKNVQLSYHHWYGTKQEWLDLGDNRRSDTIYHMLVDHTGLVPVWNRTISTVTSSNNFDPTDQTTNNFIKLTGTDNFAKIPNPSYVTYVDSVATVLKLYTATPYGPNAMPVLATQNYVDRVDVDLAALSVRLVVGQANLTNYTGQLATDVWVNAGFGNEILTESNSATGGVKVSLLNASDAKLNTASIELTPITAFTELDGKVTFTRAIKVGKDRTSNYTLADYPGILATVDETDALDARLDVLEAKKVDNTSTTLPNFTNILASTSYVDTNVTSVNNNSVDVTLASGSSVKLSTLKDGGDNSAESLTTAGALNSVNTALTAAITASNVNTVDVVSDNGSVIDLVTLKDGGTAASQKLITSGNVDTQVTAINNAISTADVTSVDVGLADGTSVKLSTLKEGALHDAERLATATALENVNTSLSNAIDTADLTTVKVLNDAGASVALNKFKTGADLASQSLITSGNVASQIASVNSAASTANLTSIDVINDAGSSVKISQFKDGGDLASQSLITSGNVEAKVTVLNSAIDAADTTSVNVILDNGTPVKLSTLKDGAGQASESLTTAKALTATAASLNSAISTADLSSVNVATDNGSKIALSRFKTGGDYASQSLVTQQTVTNVDGRVDTVNAIPTMLQSITLGGVAGAGRKLATDADISALDARVTTNADDIADFDSVPVDTATTSTTLRQLMGQTAEKLAASSYVNQKLSTLENATYGGTYQYALYRELPTVGKPPMGSTAVDRAVYCFDWNGTAAVAGTGMAYSWNGTAFVLASYQPTLINGTDVTISVLGYDIPGYGNVPVIGTLLKTEDTTGWDFTPINSEFVIDGVTIKENNDTKTWYAATVVDAQDNTNIGISTAKIQTGAVTSDKITSLATTKLSGTITNAQLAGSIQGGKISAQQISGSATAGAGHIKDGSVYAGQLASNAVTTAKITNSNVTTEKIADSNVTTAKIADSNVTTAKIADSNVTTAKINALAVTEAKIADSAVTNGKIAVGAVTGGITSGAATGSIAAKTIVAGNIADNTITATQINTGAVGSDELASDSVLTVKIKDLNVTTAKINTGAVTGGVSSGAASGKIAYKTIVGENLVDGTITTTQLAAESVQTADIKDANVTAAKIASDAVITAKIKDLNVTTAKIADSAVTNAKIDSMATSKLTGTISNDQLAGSISGDKLAAQSVSGSSTASAGIIKDGSVYSTQLASNAVTTAKITDANVTSAKIATGAVTGGVSSGAASGKIAYKTIVGENLVDGTVGGTQIATGAVTGGISGSAASGKIAYKTIVGGNLVDGTITTTQLAADSVQTADIKDANVTSAKIATGAVTGGVSSSAATGKIAYKTIVGENLVDATVGSTQLASDAVLTAKIKDLNVTTAKIAANAVTTAKIAVGNITGSELISGAVTGTIAAKTVTGANIKDYTITSDKTKFTVRTSSIW